MTSKWALCHSNHLIHLKPHNGMAHILARDALIYYENLTLRSIDTALLNMTDNDSFSKRFSEYRPVFSIILFNKPINCGLPRVQHKEKRI